MRYVRAAALCAVLGLSFFAAGCSGNGGGATPPLPVADQANQADQTNQTVSGSPLTTMSTTATAPASGTYNLHVHGEIVAIKSATEFQINGGSGVGYLNVYTTSSTVDYYNGLTPKVGYYADVYGNGSASTYVTATQVTLSTSSTFSTTSSTTTSTAPAAGTYNLHVHGPIVAIKSSAEFQINGGNGVGYLNVYTTSSTVRNYNGLTPKVGYDADVYGNGSTSTYVTATQVALTSSSTSSSSGSTTPTTTATPAPSGSVPAHVMTAAIVWGYGGVPTSVSVASVAPYVSWVQTDPSYAATMRSNGLKVDIYENFWRNYSSDNPIIGYTDLEPGGAHAAAEATDCSNTAVYDTAYGGGYEADPRTSAALAHAQTVMNYRLNEFGSNYDAVFSDDSGSVWGITLPCNYSESSYDAAVNSVHSSLGVPMWVNALGAPPNPADAVDLVAPSNVLGAMCEICYAGNGSNGDYIQTGSSWENVENAEINTVSQRKVFWDYARATGDPSIETALRTYVYASLLLSYDPSYVMLQEAFQSPTGFPVMPEAGLVALNPLTTASSVSGYQASGGAYFREFGACYYQGNFVANCAVAINPGSGTVPVPSTSYSRSLILSGGGVLDGGMIAFNGPAVSQLLPGSAVILFP